MFGLFKKNKHKVGQTRIVRYENGLGDVEFCIEKYDYFFDLGGPRWGQHLGINPSSFGTIEEAKNAIERHKMKNSIKSDIVWPEGE